MPKRDNTTKKIAESLRSYHGKRDFARTSEPRGGAGRRESRSYVIQKHDARRLHFDFRLELDGVLKSWAVPNGPSGDPAEKRLAVRTEDHPLEYGTFEGTIPEGEYGGGTVMLWDRGRWEPEGDARAGMKAGKLKFTLDGERLKGGYALIRMKPRKGEKRENWLLIKERDDSARRAAEPTRKWRKSVDSGRSMKEIAAAVKGIEKAKGRLPDFIAPQLATLVKDPPEGDEWLHEIKYDGYRAIVALGGGTARICTRNGKDWTRRFPALKDAFASLDAADTLLDGEIVAFDAGGRSSFGLLQQALNGDADDLFYVAFDLLRLGGEDLRRQPLHRRKEQLKAVLEGAPDLIRYGDHLQGKSAAVRAEACRLGLEGIVSKRRDATYVSRRSRSWLKSKCVGRDEMVIGGYRASSAKSRPFASLLLGEFGEGGLHYRGRVGTGFDEETLADLHGRLEPLRRKDSPFVDTPAEARRGARWVEPRVVIEVAYTERTQDGRLRHPAFLGLREDKAARDVRYQPSKDSSAMDDDAATVGGIRLSNPDRVLYPEQGITKRELAQYLHDVAEHMMPHVEGRPISLVRCPQGSEQKCFFQRHRVAGFPNAFKTFTIKEKKGTRADYLYIDAPEGLVAAAQMGVLELHGWCATIADIEHPDRVVFDLDPAEDVPFDDVKKAARRIRDLLKKTGLESFPLLTGGKGIHVVAPLDRSSDWPEVKAFAEGLARHLSDEEPDHFLAKASKAARKGRIFIDWLRNERGASAIVPFSPRARPGAPVAVPIAWRDLGRVSSAAVYTVRDLGERLSRQRRDPWEGFFDIHQNIP